MRRSKMPITLLVLLAVAPLAVSGCKDKSSSTAGAGTGSQASASPQPAGGTPAGTVLKLWHYEPPDSAMGIAWKQAIAAFEKSHPGVTVKFEEKGFEQIQQNAAMILNSDEAPDVMEYNKGNATAGLLSKQGLLTDLTPEATKRGWDKVLSSSLQTTARYDARGVMGGDKWFGVPNYGEFVMVYYNKDLFEKQGVKIPTSLAELEAAMATFVKAGTPPLSVAGAEYPAQQIFYLLALSKADRAFVNAYQVYQGKVDFKGPELSFGATAFADWVAKGFVPKNSAGIRAEDMGVAFAQGTFPMMISGSWWYGRMTSQIKGFQWGTFLFPGNKLHPGSSGNLWVVPARAKNKALAYEFIDETLKPAIQELLGNSGGVPVAAKPESITDPKNRELITRFNEVSAQDGLAFYPDWPVPGYYDALVAGVQELITGSKKPTQVLDDLGRTYQEHAASMVSPGK
jgi:raffinose/stachyose/melibiose transport system substrate-binding protein